MQPENSVIVIFGASGDLTSRKLMPAYFELHKNGQLPESMAILGASRSSFDDKSFRAKQRAALVDLGEKEDQTLDSFISLLYYQQLETGDGNEYSKIKRRLEEFGEEGIGDGNYMFYLATPPSLYPLIPGFLAEQGLNKEDRGWRRLVVEKPFGYDAESAAALDESLHGVFDESQIYRIDHYLGKESVQNLMVFRFANGLFEPLWNRNFIDRVEITSSEYIGVENRGGYYDGAGALRDMFQNHLLQVLALTAMEPPAVIDARFMRDEMLKVFQSLRPLSQESLEENLVLGQYTSAKIGADSIPGYREENGVDPGSRTETFVALKLFIDNWRWNGVPFYVRTGKRLPTRVTEVVIYFKNTPHPVFAAHGKTNKLVLRIQPDEGILIKFGLKKPGSGFDTQEVAMDFHYDDLDGTALLSAYARLLLDAARGDATLFTRSDAVMACWDFVQPILDFKKTEHPLYGYAAGTWGPKEADTLLPNKEQSWRLPCKNLTDASYCEL